MTITSILMYLVSNRFLVALNFDDSAM